MLFKTRVYQFANKVYKTKGGIWALGMVVPKHNNVLGILREDGVNPILIPAHNIVTNDGDTYYAQRMAAGGGESPTQTFNTHELQTAGTPGKTSNRSNFTAYGSSTKTNSSGYPKTNDADSDNTGAGVDICTHLADYAKGDTVNSGTISHGIITNPTPGASEVILTGYAFAAGFSKTSNDTLKVFVNHEALGV